MRTVTARARSRVGSRVGSLVGAIMCVALLASAAASAPAAATTDPPPPRIAHDVFTFLRGQGIASDDTSPGDSIWYSFTYTLEKANRWGGTEFIAWGFTPEATVAGYNHVGDIDVHDGLLWVPYEGAPDGTKAFGVFSAGSLLPVRTAVHTLEPGELMNNSWVAVSPDGKWLLAGEWNTMRRILVFRTADVLAGGRGLRIAGTITLDRPMVNVQGCDFSTPTRLFCQSDDADGGRPQLLVDLARPVDVDAPVAGAVSALRASPQDAVIPFLASFCSASGAETEGVDVAGGLARALVYDPCFIWSHQSTYAAP